MLCGLLGRTLGHSYSPQIHGLLGSYTYSLFEKEPEEVGDFLRNGDFTGINVTMPYKKTVIPFLDELSPTAQKLGVVNTIVRRSDGTLWGHNTDYFGFLTLVSKSGIQPAGKKALVLGSGGASCTAQRVLAELGAQVVVISRSGPENYENLHRHADAAIIVNATPLGMYPGNGVSAVDLRDFPNLEGVLDAVYNPAHTKLLLDAETLGIPHAGGLWMLIAQAKEASECFTGTVIDNKRMEDIYRQMSVGLQNIALIGMPGCGKSTVGRLLAEKTGRKILDTDEEIPILAGKSIVDIFAQDGEEVFRQFETQALESLSKQSGGVLVTGGGCVTQMRNYPLLHQNSRIFWLQRDIAKLPTDGRPLSQLNQLSQLYEARKDRYAAFADDIVDNNGSIEEAVEAILTALEGQV